MRLFRKLLPVLAASALAACAPRQGTFEWGTYDQSLLEYYEDSGKLDKLVSELERLSVAYETTSVPELGDTLSRAASDNRETRRKAVAQAELAFKPLDVGPVARLAPGLVAELGYLYLQSGNPERAIRLFEREKHTWPESAYFMDVMIRVAKGPDKTPNGDAKAIEDEAARLRAAEKARGARK
jgi:hypothetical protein